MSSIAQPLPRLRSRLATIPLDELVDEAELLTRIDRKYLLPLPTISAVLENVAEGTRVLEINGESASSYSTVYFDTPDLLSYHLAARGRRRRFKLRSRHYVDTDIAFLEMKTRGSRGTTVKERIEQSADCAGELTAAGREYAATAIAALGMTTALAADLRPVLRTRYQRTTLLLPEGARATIDTDLRWKDEHGKKLHLPALAVVETKSPSRPSSLDRLLWRHGVRPVGISKFATGLAALRPELPSNKWHAVLHRYFPTTPSSSATPLPLPN